jgi:uncharacterized membrane-anchored protein YjiN (DUF445 family)
LQLTTFLAETIKSGKITVSQNKVEALEITAQDKKIDVNAKNKEFVKDIISSVRKDSDEQPKGIISSVGSTVKTARNMQPMVKEIAEDLCREGLTVTISYKGDKVVTIGSEADSKFTRFLTGTKGVEVNSPKKLIEMGV